MKVVQCWDDGTDNDLKLMELFRRYGAKATFNLCPGLYARSERLIGGFLPDGFPNRWLALDELPSAYASFRIGAHTMTHPRPFDISLAEFRREAETSKKYLEDLFQRDVCGFAYPCNQYDAERMEIIRELGFVYARGNNDGAGLHIFPPRDAMAFPITCTFNDPAFEQKLAAAKAASEAVFYFMGHSVELEDKPERWRLFESRIALISGDPDCEWADLPDLFR